ncbi:MAG TPA: helix-turn-helix domain-containing protein [Streptosporangiaceae bacterium]|nr:helix-turn-helix domain-containing protein [Streptosporangiaceae bacterium]
MPDVARTIDLPPGQRFDYWKDVLSETFVPLEVSTPERGGDFLGRLRGTEFGSLRLIEVHAEPHTARRTARLVKVAPAGCYKIGVQLRGTSVLIQDGREATLTPGDFTFYDTDRPYTLAFSDPHRMLVLVFPRDMLGLPQHRLAGLTATRLPGEAGGMATLIGPLLVKVADLLGEVYTPGPGIGIRLAGNVVDLLGTVLAERLDSAPGDPDAAHRAMMVKITAFIEDHLGEADLAPAQIAAAHHISLRQLHKLFHANGTTVAGWIRQRRLEHCGHDLRDPRWAGRSVAAVGARWGYPDPAHFSRLFKATYGLGPRDYRASQGLVITDVVPRPSSSVR